ncbi:plasma-membrane choline transporter-domain-containing protein [Obelidium mucronatum]|nr:plasma-membrane choline transporter-domain-containing protein [Obelidium mucronatum]
MSKQQYYGTSQDPLIGAPYGQPPYQQQPYQQQPYPQQQPYGQQPQQPPYYQQPQPQFHQAPYQHQQQFQTQPGQFVPQQPHGKPPVPPSNPPQFATRRRFNDLWAAILFFVFMAGFVAMAYIGVPNVITSFKTGEFKFPHSNNTATAGGSSAGTVKLGVDTNDILGLLGASVGTGLGFSVVYFFLMLNFPGPLITISYFFNILLLLAMAGFAFYLRIIVMAVIYLIFAILTGVAYYYVRDRIPFSKLVLETVCKITARYNGTLFVALGGVILSAAFSILWLVTVLGMANFSATKNLSDAVSIVILVLLVFINFWFNEVVRNTVHVAVCGTFASYYFLGVQQPNSTVVTLPSSNTTAKSLGRALTTSFGSVCFGSLLVSIIRTLKFIANVAKNDSAQDGNILCCFLAACLECILACLADILDYFNKFAYTEIAIYGKPYCDAGKDTWNLIKYKGIDLIINDCMIGQVLGMGSFFTALLCAFAAFLYIHLKDGLGSLGNGVAVYIITCLICAFIGAWIFLVLLEVIDSGASATFVCLAEDPATIQRQLPTLFGMIQDRFPQVTWGMQSNAYN